MAKKSGFALLAFLLSLIVDRVVHPALIVADGAKGSVGALEDVYVRLGTEPPRRLPCWRSILFMTDPRLRVEE